MHDEPFWRGSNEVKRVARYKREFGTGPGLHNLGVFRIDSFRRLDYVLVRSAYAYKLNAVAYHWGGNGFIFNEGYWGPSVGFYGGIDYGFGYFGHGYEGGRWENGRFFYNTTLNNVNVNVIHDVYNTRVNRTVVNRISYNGGNGGIIARASAQEEAAGHDRHIPRAASQTQHALAARNDPQQRFSANHGAPPVAATPAPGAFKDRAIVPARQPAAAAFHPKELPPVERPASPNTGNPKLDQKYQKGQENLIAQQNQDRQKLQQSWTRIINSWRNSRLIKGERSKWSGNTSNRRSNCSKNTRSRYSRCSRNSGQVTARISRWWGREALVICLFSGVSVVAQKCRPPVC